MKKIVRITCSCHPDTDAEICLSSLGIEDDDPCWGTVHTDLEGNVVFSYDEQIDNKEDLNKATSETEFEDIDFHFSCEECEDECTGDIHFEDGSVVREYDLDDDKLLKQLFTQMDLD